MTTTNKSSISVMPDVDLILMTSTPDRAGLRGRMALQPITD